MKAKKKLMFMRVGLLFLFSLFFAAPTFAANTTIGNNLGGFLTGNAEKIIPGILIVLALWFLIKRDWPKMIGLFAMALLVSVILDWSSIKGLGKSLYDIIFSGM